jgi:hypothetical protein
MVPGEVGRWCDILDERPRCRSQILVDQVNLSIQKLLGLPDVVGGSFGRLGLLAGSRLRYAVAPAVEEVFLCEQQEKL